jgi:hypothetical protein
MASFDHPSRSFFCIKMQQLRQPSTLIFFYPAYSNGKFLDAVKLGKGEVFVLCAKECSKISEQGYFAGVSLLILEHPENFSRCRGSMVRGRRGR